MKTIQEIDEHARLIRLKRLLEQYNYPLWQFRPRPDDIAVHDEQTSFFNYMGTKRQVLLGGTSSGKTYTAVCKLMTQLLNTEPPEKYSPVIITYESTKQCGKMWQQKWLPLIPPGVIDSISWTDKRTRSPREILLRPIKGKQFSLIWQTYEMDVDEFAAIDAHAYLLDEQCPWQIATEIEGRMRRYVVPGGKIWCLTPLQPHEELRQIWENQEMYPQFKFFHLNTLCNQYNSEEWREDFLSILPKQFLSTRTYGAFASFSGSCFAEFDKENIIEPFDIPKSWKTFIGIDPGMNHPTGVVAVAKYDDVYYVYDEYLKNKTRIEDHADAIKTMKINKDNHSCYCDPGGPGAQFILEFQRYGIFAVNARKEPVFNRTEYVASLIKQNKIKVFNTCKHTISQVRSCEWERPPRRSALNPQPPKPRPRKVNDDLTDALAYVIWTDKSDINESYSGGDLASGSRGSPLGF